MRHPFSGLKIPVPNPHSGDLDWSLTKRILKQAGVSREKTMINDFVQADAQEWGVALAGVALTD